MIRLSSIFSFETIRLKPWFPKATVAALALLIAAEMTARYAVHTHRLHVDASARQLIDDHRNAVTSNQGDIWLLGNSTLGYGVNEKLLAQRTGARLLKLPHGSATVAASSKLLDYYLSIAPKPPKEVVLFVSKDDFNLNGYRAEVSAEYESLIQNPARKPYEYSVLFQARSHIADRVTSTFERVLHRGKAIAPSKPAPEPYFDGTIADDDVVYSRLVKNFALDQDAIAAVGVAAHRHGLHNIVIVLVPCTDVYAQYHDRKVGNPTYAGFRTEVASECDHAGVKFDDFGDPSRKYHDFYDGYHLNNDGAVHFTEELVASHVIATQGPAIASSPSTAAAPVTDEAASVRVDSPGD